MSRLLQCPDADRLRDLLDGMLADREQDDLSRHLDHCPHCQRRLESLTAGEEVWAGAARLGRWRAEAGPALGCIMATLADARLTETTPGLPGGSEHVLSFLAPSSNPNSLG
jgi:anti-sigma factor RsiW